MPPLVLRRLAGVAFVLVLHIAIVLVFLHISVAPIARMAEHAGEIVWLLPPPKKPVPVTPNTEPRPNESATRPPHEALPDYHGITIPNAPPAPAPSLGGLHGALFGCADLDHLSPEQRTHCGSALAAPDNTVDFRDGVVRSQQAALWERGRLRKNGALLLPCMNPQGFSPLATAACLAQAAIAGELKPQEQPSYADKPQITHLPNNGDPPEHPTGF